MVWHHLVPGSLKCLLSSEKIIDIAAAAAAAAAKRIK